MYRKCEDLACLQIAHKYPQEAVFDHIDEIHSLATETCCEILTGGDLYLYEELFFQEKLNEY